MKTPPWLDTGLAVNGRRVAENFAAWFEGSRAVDAAGAPAVVYHGSRSPWLVQFDLSMEGTGVVRPTRLGGIWFSSKREAAGYFADPAPKRTAVDMDLYGQAGRWYASVTDRRGDSIFQDGPHLTEDDAFLSATQQMKAYNAQLRQNSHVGAYVLSLRNPLELEGVIPRQAEFDRARQHGHDGIIAREVVDGDRESDVLVAFRPNQVKSLMNCGLFVPGSACLRDLAAARKLELAIRAAGACSISKTMNLEP